MTEVSIIIPMHNAADDIEQCLSGILSQSIKNFEVILVDDGSTDDTVEKAKKYGFRIVTLKDGGNPSRARNFGAKQASGNILVFVDSDIVLQPDSIENIVSKVSEKDIASVSGIYTKETPADSFFSQLQNLILYYRLSKIPEFVTFTNSAFYAIKRDVFETIQGYNEKMSYFEDVEIGHRLTQNGYKLRLDSSLSVTHLKNFNHWGLICDYFKKAAVSGRYKSKNYSKDMKSDELVWHIKISGASTGLVLFSVFLIGISIIPFLVSLTVYSLFLSPLLLFLIKTKGLYFGLRSYFVCFELFAISFVALIYGSVGGSKSD